MEYKNYMGRSFFKFISIIFFISLLFPLFSLDMVSVIDFKAEGGVSEYEASILRSVLETELISSGKYHVIEKTEQEQVISAQKDTLQGCVDDACAVEIGKLLAADKILTGIVAKFGNRFILTVKIIHIETGRSIKAENIRATDLESLLDGLDTLVINITRGEQSTSFGSAAEIVEPETVDLKLDIPDNFVLVEGGTFLMGSDEGDNNEKPVHTVTVGDFIIGKYEVTQMEWESVMETDVREQRDKANPEWSIHGKGTQYPIYYVSWNEAVEFCNKLSEREGRDPVYWINGSNVVANWSKNGYRLPTEAEWEFAARGGNKSKGNIYSGSNIIESVAWYVDNSENKTHLVGGKNSNELGIHDMSGNVYEWCWDLYGDYTNENQRDPFGSSSGSKRVIRSGCYIYYPSFSRVAARYYEDSSNRSRDLGFRLVLSADM